VGRVEAIRVAPDNRLIGVVMKINMRDNLQKNTVAQLKTAGITGIVFVDLDLRKPGEPDLSPQINFPSEFPIIPSRPSEMHKILSGINEVVEKLKKIDTKALSDQLLATGQAIQNLVQNKKITSILTRLDATTGNLEQVSARLARNKTGDKLNEILTEARDTLRGTRKTVTALHDQIMAMQLPATMGKTRDIARELNTASNNLRQSSETLEMLLQRIYDRPSDILFGKPPKKRWNE
ncbi:MAG TPA: MlaD family protein, partial [Desulfobaccales bacterium]|nr:MlaD family protein [Desulfobaccales bacterium]